LNANLPRNRLKGLKVKSQRMGKRIAYTLISSADQQTDRHLDDMTFDKVFEDKISRTSPDRPEFNKMLHYIEPNRGDHIYVYEISILGSSMLDLYQKIDVIRKKRASLTFIKEQITFDPDYELREAPNASFGMLTIFDKFENSLIKKTALLDPDSKNLNLSHTRKSNT
jgi:DNA invertase Pin-like site-specific DNA recombinase